MVGPLRQGLGALLFRIVGSAGNRRHPVTARARVGVGGLPYCMNQPWLTTSDWPVHTLDDAAAKNRTASATSSVVVNSPSTVSFSMTLRMTSASEGTNSLCAATSFLESGKVQPHR